MSETHITPGLLREYAHRLLVQPPGAHDPQDWDEMTTMFARAFRAAAARIEQLERGGVSVHEVTLGGQKCTLVDDGSVRRELEARIAALEAEGAVLNRAGKLVYEEWTHPGDPHIERLWAQAVSDAREALAREQDVATGQR